MMRFMSLNHFAAGRALKQAQYRNHRALDRALAEVGTTLVQWDALRAIHESPASSAHRLALATFQSDQSFGTLGNRLEAQGLIQRAQGPGRSVEHRLTTKGQRTLEAGQKVAAEVVKQSFSRLTASEVMVLQELLQRVGTPLE